LFKVLFLRRRLRDAIEEHRQQQEIFSEFCEQQTEFAEQWKREVREWEAAEDGAKPKNPFDSPYVGASHFFSSLDCILT
jgi:hypothetical protein